MTLASVRQIVADSEGVEALDNRSYHVPVDIEGSDRVYVSRLRRDPSRKNAFWMWVVADNLRKGAALNAVQIAEELITLSS